MPRAEGFVARVVLTARQSRPWLRLTVPPWLYRLLVVAGATPAKRDAMSVAYHLQGEVKAAEAKRVTPEERMSTVRPARSYAWARKVIFTLAAGAISYLVARYLNGGIAFAAGAAIFLGGVVLVVMHQVDMNRRLDSVNAELRQHVSSTESLLTRRFDDLSLASVAFARLTASGIPSEPVMRLVDDLADLDRGNDLVVRFAQAEMARMGRLVHDLRRGSDSVYEGEDRDWMLNLTRSVFQSIDSVSVSTADLGVDGGLWLTDLGQRYLQLQRDAIERGVTTRRVFVAEDADMLEEAEFYEICDMQRRLGIQVKKLDLHDAPGILANTMFNFTLFDNALSYEPTPVSVRTHRKRPTTIISTRLVHDETRVKERVRRFAELWDAARELSA